MYNIREMDKLEIKYDTFKKNISKSKKKSSQQPVSKNDPHKHDDIYMANSGGLYVYFDKIITVLIVIIIYEILTIGSIEKLYGGVLKKYYYDDECNVTLIGKGIKIGLAIILYIIIYVMMSK